MPKLLELPYIHDSACWFDRVADAEFSIFFDSGLNRSGDSRYDLILVEPIERIQLDAGAARSPESRVINGDGELFELLRQALGSPCSKREGLAFCGGLAGFLSYDAGRLTESIATSLSPDLCVPDVAVGIYDAVLLIDHDQRRCCLIGDDGISIARWNRFVKLFAPPVAKLPPASLPAISGPLTTTMQKDDYNAAFSKVKQHILAGDCYQINLTQRLSVDYNASSWELYRYLRSVNSAPMAAFIKLPQQTIMSFSPERFIKCVGGNVETNPIKGTRPRASPGYEDLAQAEDLLFSDKDRAENLMIVDLLRNDLAKSCIPGSISVPKLFRLESFTTVHHLVSSITGRLHPDKDSLDLLRYSFPGGSITGAPKRRAMEIIEKLENNRRHVYCGSIFYMDRSGDMDSNIAIRTMVHEGGRLHYWAGGGVVYDSTADREYHELFDKAAIFTRLFS